MLERKIVESTIGKGMADNLDEVIMNGSPMLSFTRREMVEKLGCANFIAAAELGKILKKLKITTAAELHKTDPFSLARIKRVGPAKMLVIMCILDTFGYDVVKWWGWKDTNTLKFLTFKAQAMKRASKRQHEI
jgi:hypothetical protein